MQATDVVVIGAGYSGLIAADALARTGANVVVLEARDRVGGRSLSTSCDGQTVDLGGQWIGDTHQRLHRLAAELGLQTFPQHATGKKRLVLGDGRVRDCSNLLVPKIGLLGLLDLGQALLRLERLSRRIHPEEPLAGRLAAKLDLESVADWISRRAHTSAARELLILTTQMVLAAEPQQVSLLYLLLYARAGRGLLRLTQIDRGAQERRFVAGSQAVAQRLATRLGVRVRLGVVAQAISQDDSSVVVHSSAGAVRAKRAILALPPALLRLIDFSPALPVQRSRLHEAMPMGSVIKCVVSYARPFWREAGFSGEALATTGWIRATFDDSSPDASHAALVGFVVGDAAKQLAALPAAQRRVRVIEAFAALHGPKALEVRTYVDHNWLDEPWSRGCYVGVMPPGLLTQTAAALRAPCGRVHFAGTETAIEHIGYFEGAIEAGERAAREVTGLLPRPAVRSEIG